MTAIPGIIPNTDFFLEVAKGNIAGHSHINKYGRSSNADTGVPTDVWDRANPTDDQDIWIAPTTARIHDIVSTSSSDDGSPVGVGARTIRLCGLTGWNAAEVSEVITLNGLSSVATSNSYVIIYRMEVLTKGGTAVNVGTITATAQVDGTVTAQINANGGQTQMAILGIPSTQIAYLTQFYSTGNQGAGSRGNADMSLLVNPEPDNELLNYIVKNTRGLVDAGTSNTIHSFIPYFKIPGPAIIKVQVIGSVNNMDISAGFDVFLVDN